MSGVGLRRGGSEMVVISGGALCLGCTGLDGELVGCCADCGFARSPRDKEAGWEVLALGVDVQALLATVIGVALRVVDGVAVAAWERLFVASDFVVLTVGAAGGVPWNELLPGTCIVADAVVVTAWTGPPPAVDVVALPDDDANIPFDGGFDGPLEAELGFRVFGSDVTPRDILRSASLRTLFEDPPSELFGSNAGRRGVLKTPVLVLGTKPVFCVVWVPNDDCREGVRNDGPELESALGIIPGCLPLIWVLREVLKSANGRDSSNYPRTMRMLALCLLPAAVVSYERPSRARHSAVSRLCPERK